MAYKAIKVCHMAFSPLDDMIQGRIQATPVTYQMVENDENTMPT